MTKFRTPKQTQETFYNGCRFRSRLEARWAAFFDAMNISYEYMPQEFVLQDGTRFTPNFKLFGFQGRGSGGSAVLWAAVTEAFDWNEEKDHQEFYKNMWQFCQGSSHGYIVNPAIVLPPFPDELNDWFSNMVTTFAYVDGDTCACVIAKREEEPDCEEFMLCGDDCCYIEDWQFEITEEALEKARGTRLIPWEEMKKW